MVVFYHFEGEYISWMILLPYQVLTVKPLSHLVDSLPQQYILLDESCSFLLVLRLFPCCNCCIHHGVRLLLLLRLGGG